MKIDITAGDQITYREIKYNFSLMLEDRKIQIWSYNIETIISEKFEAIIKRGILGTRIRDFYDIHMLLNTQSKNIDKNTLKDAIISTAKHRDTLEEVLNWNTILKIIAQNESMKKQWIGYQKDNFYAVEIRFEDLIESIKKVGLIFDEN